MYKNLIQAPVKELVFISAVTDPLVASLLAESGIEEGSEIVKIGEGETLQAQQQAVVIKMNEKGTELKLTVSEAKEILVRACDICWHCGECMVDG